LSDHVVALGDEVGGTPEVQVREGRAKLGGKLLAVFPAGWRDGRIPGGPRRQASRGLRQERSARTEAPAAGRWPGRARFHGTRHPARGRHSPSTALVPPNASTYPEVRYSPHGT